MPALTVPIPHDEGDAVARRTLIASAFEYARPLILNKVTAAGGSVPSTEKVDGETIVVETVFTGIDVRDQYLRPNGQAYRPRSMTVGADVVHDVTFVRAAASVNKPVLLYGPPGTGKTALIEAAFNEDVVTVQGTIETETADFVGSWVQDPDGTYRWVDGPLLVAADEGKKLFIDEIALIDPRSLAVVYGAMDGRGEITVTQNPKRGKVKVQPGFLVVGAFNPNVPGAIMSDALMSRFPIQVEVTTDWTLASKLGIPSKIIQITRNLNHKVETGEMSAAPQLREMLDYRDLVKNFGEQFALQNYLGQVRPENRPIALEAIKAVMGTTPTILSL